MSTRCYACALLALLVSGVALGLALHDGRVQLAPAASPGDCQPGCGCDDCVRLRVSLEVADHGYPLGVRVVLSGCYGCAGPLAVWWGRA